MLSTLAITVSPFNLWKPQIFFQLVLRGKRSNGKCPPSELRSVGGGCPYFPFPPPRCQWLAGPMQGGPGGRSHGLTLKGSVTKKPHFFPPAFLFSCCHSTAAPFSQSGAPAQSGPKMRNQGCLSATKTDGLPGKLLSIIARAGAPCFSTAPTSVLNSLIPQPDAH